MATLLDKLLQRTSKTDSCWIWTGHVNKQGYGRFHTTSSHRSAHLLVYEQLVGRVDKGLHLDHLCRNTRCVNPEHLEPVTPKENTMRSPIAIAAVNSRKTHCINGHEFTLENTYVPPKRLNRRYCKACQRDRDRDRVYIMRARIAS